MKVKDISWRRIPTLETTLRIATILVCVPLFVLTTVIVPTVPKLWLSKAEDPAIPSLLSLWFSISTLLIFGSLIVLILISFILPSILAQKLKVNPLQRKGENLLGSTQDKNADQSTERIYVLDCDDPNAFVLAALRKKPKIILTTALMQILRPAEIEAVIKHEIGHIRNRDSFFMMWGTTFSRTLKYWVFFSLILELVSVALLWLTHPQQLKYAFGMIFWILAIFGICFFTLNSASRIREKLADAQVVDTEFTPALVSAIRKMTFNRSISSRKIMSQTDPLTYSFPHVMFANPIEHRRLPKWIEKYFVSDHPEEKERIKSVQEGKFFMTKGKVYPLSVESAFFVGLIGIILLAASLKGTELIPDFGFRILDLSVSSFLMVFSLFMPCWIAIFTTWIMLMYSYLPSIQTKPLVRFFVVSLFHHAISYFVVIIFFLAIATFEVMSGFESLTNMIESVKILFPIYFDYLLVSVACTPLVLLATKFLIGYLQMKYPSGQVPLRKILRLE